MNLTRTLPPTAFLEVIEVGGYPEVVVSIHVTECSAAVVEACHAHAGDEGASIRFVLHGDPAAVAAFVRRDRRFTAATSGAVA